MKKSINKGTWNYSIDIIIAIGFIVSAGTGLVLVFFPSSGVFPGGRNIHYLYGFLGMSAHWWKDLHAWSSYLMAGGVLGHLLLHLKWMGCMTRKIFFRRPEKAAKIVCETVT